jgi:calcium-dependent protein kinase
LKKYKSTCKLQSALEGFILYHLGKNLNKDELEQAFKVLDKDGTGTLDIGEIRHGFKYHYGGRMDYKDIDTIYKEIDINGNGSIDYNEFISAAVDREELMTQENLVTAFNLIDTEKTGALSVNNLRSALAYTNDIVD